MPTIVDLSRQEDTLVAQAPERYGLWFVYPEQALILLDGGITGMAESRRPAFGRFWAQVILHLQLAMLSSLRRHAIQASVNLRHVTEYICLCSYALEHPEVSNFIIQVDDRIDLPKKQLRKVYGWLEQAHPQASKSLHFIKDAISSSHGHGNIINSGSTVKLEPPGGITYTFFDETGEEYTKAALWRVGTLALIASDLVDFFGIQQHRVVAMAGFKAEQQRLAGFRDFLYDELLCQTGIAADTAARSAATCAT